MLCSAHLGLSFYLSTSLPSVWLECLYKFSGFHSNHTCPIPGPPFPPSGNTSRFPLSLVSSFLIHSKKTVIISESAVHIMLLLLRNFQRHAMSSFFPHLHSHPASLVPSVFPELVPCDLISISPYHVTHVPEYPLILIPTPQNPTQFSGHK